MVSWWDMVDSFRLPETVPGSGRIGKGPSTFPVDVVELNGSPSTLSVVTSTQEPAPAAATPLEATIVELINVAPRGNYQRNNHNRRVPQKVVLRNPKITPVLTLGS